MNPSPLSAFDPTGRFSGLAGLYGQYRPDYPAQALDYFLARCGLSAGKLVVDVGAGTGISSRLLALRGLCVIAVEPNGDMRQQAESTPLPPGASPPQYRAGRAEDTGLADAGADAVVSAQAFHWFVAEAALMEFHRILKPGGWVVLLWNERDPRDPFTAAYGAIVRNSPQGDIMEHARATAGQLLLTHPLFQDAALETFGHEQRLTEEQMLGRALSVSYAPRMPDQVAAYTSALRAVFARFQREGAVVLQYQTFVYTARKAS